MEDEEELMLIICEGVDRTGKTTLANRLAGELGGARVIHAGPPSRHPLEEYETALTGYDPTSGQHLILDRWHLGEHVWPRIFGRDTQLDTAVARHLELYMRSRGAEYVIGDRDHELLAAELMEHGEPLTPQLLPTADELFTRAVMASRRSAYTWDYEWELGHAQGVKEIMALAEFRQRDVSPIWRLTGDWIGDPRPRVMLVGDRWGSERAASPAVPFAPFPNTCGHYLMRALPDTWWHECAIVNAYTRDSQDEEWRPQPLGAINAALGSPPIIALGWAAASALANMGLDSAHVFHPQYWKRFYFHDISAYTIPLQLAREDAESG